MNHLRPQVFFCGVYFNWFWWYFVEAAEMFQVHRLRSMDWKPTTMVALAMSIDQSQVAFTREDTSIEIWNVAPDFVGWHCELEILGRDGSVISSLSSASQSQVPVHLVVYSQLVWMDPFQNGTLVLYSRRLL